jgi:flagellar motor switch protein FliM
MRVSMATFGRQATTVLTTSLRTACLLSLAEVEELSYDEYLSTLSTTARSAPCSPWSRCRGGHC